jgi:hypothetical protein
VGAGACIGSEFTKVILQDLIRALRAAGSCPAELVSVLTELHTLPALSSPSWTPVLGHAYVAAARPELRDPVAEAVNVALSFAGDVRAVLLACDFSQPQRLIMEPVVLPETSHVSIDWSPPDLRLTAPNYSACFTVTEAARVMKSFCPAGGVTLPTFNRRGSFNVLTDSRVSVFPPLDLKPAEIKSGDSLSELLLTEELLRGAAPEYLDWITPMVRYLVLSAAPRQGFTSGSDRFNPGVVAVSFPIDVVSFAESLVHETSHQYYFLLSCASDLTDPNHQQLYVSPLRRTARPLDKILLAYHAVANIICLYQLLISRGAPHQPSHPAVERVVLDYEILAGHLLDNPWLTDAGRALFEPIHNLIMARRWMNFDAIFANGAS